MTTHGKSRTVSYRFFDREFYEPRVEAILERAKTDGVVVDFDTGRGYAVWFYGYAGAGLRSVRRAVIRAISEGPH